MDREAGQTAITEFVFQVCGRCGHPPSDGPCRNGEPEHAETYPHTYASFGVVKDLLNPASNEHSPEERFRRGVEQARDWSVSETAALNPQLALGQVADRLDALLNTASEDVPEGQANTVRCQCGGEFQRNEDGVCCGQCGQRPPPGSFRPSLPDQDELARAKAQGRELEELADELIAKGAPGTDKLRIIRERDRALARVEALTAALTTLLDSLAWDDVEYEHWTVDDEPVQEARAALETASDDLPHLEGEDERS